MHWLRAADQFGIGFTPPIGKQQSTYQSILGGITSMLIYSTALSYFIYKFYLWQSYQLPPTTNTQSMTEPYSQVLLGDESLQFSVSSSTGLNPFDPGNMILIPLLQIYSGIEVVALSTVQEISHFGDVGYGGYLKKITLIKNASVYGNSSQVALIITPCTDIMLYVLNISNHKCADNKTQEIFLQSYNMFHMDIEVNQFNSESREIKKSRNSFVFLMDIGMPTYTQVQLKLTNSFQDTGVLFQSITQEQFISDFIVIPQTVSPSFVQRIFQFQVITATLLRLDSISNKLIVTYPKLGNILADIGSIFTSLLSLKLVILLVNEKLMLEEFYDQIIAFYYPEIKLVKINYTHFRKVKSIEVDNKPVKDIPGMLKYLKTLRSEAKCKLTVLNSIYELSRLQFIVNSIQQRETLLLSHQVGIKLRYQQFMVEPSEQVQFSPRAPMSENFDNQMQEEFSPRQMQITKNGDNLKQEQLSVQIRQSSYNQETLQLDSRLKDHDFNLLSIDNRNHRINGEGQNMIPTFYLVNQVT